MLSLPHDVLEIVCAEKETARALRPVCKSAAAITRGLFHLKRTAELITLTGKYNSYTYEINNHIGPLFIRPLHGRISLYGYIVDHQNDEMDCCSCSGFATTVPHVITLTFSTHINKFGIALRGNIVYLFDAALADEILDIAAAFDGVYLVAAAIMMFPGGDGLRELVPPQMRTVFLNKFGEILLDRGDTAAEDGYTILLRPYLTYNDTTIKIPQQDTAAVAPVAAKLCDHWFRHNSRAGNDAETCDKCGHTVVYS